MRIINAIKEINRERIKNKEERIKRFNTEKRLNEIAKSHLGEYPILSLLLEDNLAKKNVNPFDFLDALILSAAYMRTRYPEKDSLFGVASNLYSDPKKNVFPRFAYSIADDEMYIWKSVGKGKLAIPKKLFDEVEELRVDGLVEIVTNTAKDSCFVVARVAEYRNDTMLYKIIYEPEVGIGIKISYPDKKQSVKF